MRLKVKYTIQNNPRDPKSERRFLIQHKYILLPMRTFFILLLVVFLFSCSEKKTPADIIITGGEIYTMNSAQPKVESVVVSGTKIVFAGSRDEAMEYKGDNTKIIDLEGKTMTPGFIEGHGHIMGL